MNELVRYLVSIDQANGAVKVEQIGEAGDLTEVAPGILAQFLGGSGSGANNGPQTVINIYAGGSPVRMNSLAVSSGLPEVITAFDCPPPPPPPKEKPEKPDKK